MKAIISALLLAFTSVAAQADISVDASTKNQALRLILTGTEAQSLKEIVQNYDGVVDSILSKGAAKNDFSMIRSIWCENDTCIMELEADALTKKDTQEYYSKKLNDSLQNLADNEVLVSPPMGKSNDASAILDSRFLRLMMEKSISSNQIRVKTTKPGSLKNPDQIQSPLYEVSMKSGKLSVTCYSSIVTGMGNVNYLSESCSVSAIGHMK